MPRTCIPDFSAARNPEQGWTAGPWASADIFGEPVPLNVTRFRLDAGAHVPGIAR